MVDKPLPPNEMALIKAEVTRLREDVSFLRQLLHHLKDEVSKKR